MKAIDLKETAEGILLIGYTMCDDTDAMIQDTAKAMRLIQAYTISPCDCKDDETTGSITEDVCNNCGRSQK